MFPKGKLPVGVHNQALHHCTVHTVPALEKKSPVSQHTMQLIHKVNNTPSVEPSTVHINVSHGNESHSQHMPPEPVQHDLLTPWDTQGHDPPEAAGEASDLGNMTSNRERHLECISCEEDVAWKSGSPAIPLQIYLEGEDFLDVVHKGYAKDTLFSKIMANVEHYPQYSLRNGVLYFTNAVGNPVVAILGSLSKGRRVTKIAIDQAHQIISHKATRKMCDYLAHWYWWPTMTKDVEAFCKSCRICQTTKTSTTKPSGLLHTLPNPNTPWLSIAMDFMGPFPEVHGYDYLLVVIC